VLVTRRSWRAATDEKSCYHSTGRVNNVNHTSSGQIPRARQIAAAAGTRTRWPLTLSSRCPHAGDACAVGGHGMERCSGGVVGLPSAQEQAAGSVSGALVRASRAIPSLNRTRDLSVHGALSCLIRRPACSVRASPLPRTTTRVCGGAVRSLLAPIQNSKHAE
jgi:hypothetical protein